jgi:uncharacterized damage-inducible protein DinB
MTPQLQMTLNPPEVWLRGPLPDVPALLQPVAHALLQAREEVTALMADFPDELLWERLPTRSGAELASAGFHLQHLTGVLDRLLTYARAETLTDPQLMYLNAEGQPNGQPSSILLLTFCDQIDRALAQLIATNPATLTDARGVGRAQLPATVLGLLVHAAEHTMRHVGQLSVTVRVLRG